MQKSFSTSQIEKIYPYFEALFKPEDSTLVSARKHSTASGLPPIQVAPSDALHLEVLVRAFRVTTAVEIGTLGGYSAISIARGLRSGGRLYSIDVDKKHTRVAQENLTAAGLENQVELITGQARMILPDLPQKTGPIDLVFIDADKANYPFYLDWAAENLRMGGIVLADNVWGWNQITDTEFENEDERATIEALRLFNEKLAKNGRFRATILPTGEGLALGVKIQ